jgi:hypothetical protein
MSVPPLSKILRFLLVAAGLIIVFSVLWNFIDAEYSTFLGQIASKVVPAEYKVEQREGTVYFTRQYFIMDIGGKPTPVKVPENYPADHYLVASAIQFGLLLTIALVAATPGLSWVRRIIASLVAAAVTFVLQVISVIIMGLTFNSILFVIVSDLFPPLLWAFFSYRYWFHRQPVLQQNLTAPPKTNQKSRTQ